MKIESVRDLKLEIGELASGNPIQEPLPAGMMNFITRRAVPAALASFSLGVARGQRNGDYRLAVRMTQRRTTDDVIIDRIRQLASGEADIRYVGRIVKSTVKQPTVWHQSRCRPLTIGVSIGHPEVAAGTLGCFAVHRPTGLPSILSNNHVLADEDRASPGDRIWQPGRIDGGQAPTDAVAELFEASRLMPQPNTIDAAIAKLMPEVLFNPTLLQGVGTLNGLRGEPVEPGDRVVKIGRTTGVTHGVVTSIELDDVVVKYDTDSYSFNGQIEIEGSGGDAFSAAGDSGSLIVDESGLACAMLFAGSEHGGTNGKGLTIANDIHNVFATLNLELAPITANA